MALTNNTTQEMSYLTIGSNTYEIVDATARSQSGSGTVTSVAVSNNTNGGLSVSGSPITTNGTITIGHSNVLTSAQTTQAVYPIKIDKNGHISAYGTAVSIPTQASDIGAAPSSHDHGNITSGGDITATAPTIANGDQIVINDSSASKITNGPTFDGSTTTKALTPKGTWETFSTSDTNTTYALSNALSSHKFTETLTAGGSGSGTSTATMEFVAGTGITLTDDTTNKKITIASSVTNTDENVKSTAVTAATTNYLVGSTTSSTTTGGLSKHASGVLYTTADSATSGYTQLRLGNTTATSSAGGKEGQIRLYGTNATYYVDLKAGAIASSNKTITFPNATGTIALTSDIPTVPTITLNGSSTTSASFYAPTSAGTDGYYLKSNGSGAPSWTSFPTIPTAGASTPEPVSASSAGAGSATTYSKSDHIHNIGGTTVTDALGYTPYHSFGSWTTINRSTMTGGWAATGDGFLTISGTAASSKTPYVYIQTTQSGTTYNIATYNCASGGQLGITFPVKSGWTYTMLYDTTSGAWTTTPVTRFMPLE